MGYLIGANGVDHSCIVQTKIPVFLEKKKILANLMHGHSDSSWSGSSLPEITEQSKEFFMFYFIASISD